MTDQTPPMTHHSEPAREAVALLPCPFCGGKADWHNIGNEHTKSRSTKIWCSECRVTRNTGAIRHSLEWTKEHAFAAWNRRASPAPAAGGLEAVREALREARGYGSLSGAEHDRRELMAALHYDNAREEDRG